MKNTNRIAMTSVFLAFTTMGSNLAQATTFENSNTSAAQNNASKNKPVKNNPWKRLALGNCRSQTTADESYSFLYCKGAPLSASVAVIDHNTVNYSATTLNAAQCHASLNGRNVVCFNADMGNQGIEIHGVTAVPAANSCDSLAWKIDESGELNLQGNGCRQARGGKNRQPTRVNLFDFMDAIDAWDLPTVINHDGELHQIGLGSEVEDEPDPDFGQGDKGADENSQSIGLGSEVEDEPEPDKSQS